MSNFHLLEPYVYYVCNTCSVIPQNDYNPRSACICTCCGKSEWISYPNFRRFRHIPFLQMLDQLQTDQIRAYTDAYLQHIALTDLTAHFRSKCWSQFRTQQVLENSSAELLLDNIQHKMEDSINNKTE
jgi:hypothetical protein